MLSDVQHVNRPQVPSRQRRAGLDAKSRRERLFRKSRPLARRLEILDGEQYSKDISILWAAYKAGSFNMTPDLGQGEFANLIEEQLRGFQTAWMVDDDSVVFSSKRGPVAMVCANAIGLIVEPRFVFFKWATPRNKLRTVAAVLNMLRHSKKTGVALVRTTRDKMTLPDHLKKYDMLYFVGKVADDEYLYSIRGRGSDGVN